MYLLLELTVRKETFPTYTIAYLFIMLNEICWRRSKEAEC